MTRHGLFLALAIGAALLGRPAVAAPADLTRLFKYEGDIVPAEPEARPDDSRLLRLVLPREVIAAARADLSDVRIFDPQGSEVPFVVDSGLRVGEVRAATESVAAKVLDLRRDQFTPRGAPTQYREVYELEAPPPPASGSQWELVFESERPQFLRSVELAAVRRGEATPLGAGGTIFRVRASDVEHTAIDVPPFEAERLRVTLEGADGFYLEPRFRFRGTAVFTGGEPAVVPLEVLSRGRTVVAPTSNSRGRTVWSPTSSACAAARLRIFAPPRSSTCSRERRRCASAAVRSSASHSVRRCRGATSR